MKQPLLITGAAGFIGSNFARLLAKCETAGERPIILFDALTYAGNIASIKDLMDEKLVTFVHGNICNIDEVRDVFQRFSIESVAHFAAETHVDRSILGARAFAETNITGTLNLLLAAQETWQENWDNHCFLHISTDEVYGTLCSIDPPFNEETPYAPNSPYSASKAASDHLVRAWHQTYGFPSIITNCSNNYGPWQFPEKLIPLMILNAAEGRELPIYGDGLQVRDWLHVQDHCEALKLVLERGTLGQTYCIGGDNEQTNLHVVHTVCDLVDERLERLPGTSRALVRLVTDRPGHDRRYAIDTTKINRELSWTSRFNFAEALGEVVDWYLAHKEWIDSIRSGDYRRYYDEQYGKRLEERR
jgi:dTDP-glucose 4,6-dehydratase